MWVNYIFVVPRKQPQQTNNSNYLLLGVTLKSIFMTEVLAHHINANTPKRLVTNRSTRNCSNNPDQLSTESRMSQRQHSSYSTEMKWYLYSLFLRKITNIAHTFPLFHNSIASHCLLLSSFLDVHKNGA